MSINSIHKIISNNYKQIDRLAKDNPIAAIVYSIAIKTFAILFCAFSSFLGLTTFLLSLTFDIAILKNLNTIGKRIDNLVSDWFDSEEKRNARECGRVVRNFFDTLPDRIEGFAQGLGFKEQEFKH